MPPIDETSEGLTGLSDEEVTSRVAAGQTNANTDVKTKSAGQIWAEHLFTPLNAVVAILALIVGLTGEHENLLFALVAVCNVIIGVGQELHSKHLVDDLALLTQKTVTVMRAGEKREVSSSDLVVDDIIFLAHGDQIPADSIILSGHVSIDESLLTGEAKPVSKGPGDELFSGSFVESGDLIARVTRVGMDGYAARINAEAKHTRPVQSVILDTLDSIVRVGAGLAIPLGIGVFIRSAFYDGLTLAEAALTAVSSILGMIPQGLALLTSSVLVIATMRLAKKDVLVQQPYCVETLARVDTLCLDKTGTITSGDMEVSEVQAVSGHELAEVNLALAQIVRANEADANETAQAILAYEKTLGTATSPTARAIPFSSNRKFSGCVAQDGRAYVMGAAGFVLNDASDLARADALAKCFDPTDRVLVVGEAAGFDDEGHLIGPVQLLGCVAIRDQVREGAPETMAFFRDNDVDIRVISGDDARTTSAVAERAGVPHAGDYVDASTLDTPEKLADAATRYHVFGRVTPQQKRDLVAALRAEGHTVAMVGDGVNDVLALREADCSIAMRSGSTAARNVSDVVLVQDDFSRMPDVVAEGRRSINNLQRSSVLFLFKTGFTAFLALVSIFMPPYPFIPIQMTLFSTALIGIPSFILALEPNHDRLQGDFLLNVLARSLPASLATSITLLVALILGRAFGQSFEELSMVCTILASVIGAFLVWRISRPLTPLRTALLIFVVAIVVLGCTIFAPIFSFADLTVEMLLTCLVDGAGGAILFNCLYSWSLEHFETSKFLRHLVELVGRLGHRGRPRDSKKEDLANLD